MSIIEKHYDKPDYVEEMEKRRYQYLDRMDFVGMEGDEQ